MAGIYYNDNRWVRSFTIVVNNAAREVKRDMQQCSIRMNLKTVAPSRNILLAIPSFESSNAHIKPCCRASAFLQASLLVFLIIDGLNWRFNSLRGI